MGWVLGVEFVRLGLYLYQFVLGQAIPTKLYGPFLAALYIGPDLLGLCGLLLYSGLDHRRLNLLWSWPWS